MDNENDQNVFNTMGLLSDCSDEGGAIPSIYWAEVAKIYATLPKFKHIKEEI